MTFQSKKLVAKIDNDVVTHQWSGDLSILVIASAQLNDYVVTQQWSGDLSIDKAIEGLESLKS